MLSSRNGEVSQIFSRALHSAVVFLGRNRVYVYSHFSIDLNYCDVIHAKKVVYDKFSPPTEVVQMCVHSQELLDIVNNQSTLEGFNLDDVKVMLRELCEN